MTFQYIIPLDDLPRKDYKKLADKVIAEFLASNAKVVKLSDNCLSNYKDIDSAYSTFRNYVTKHKLPIRVVKRGDSIFLARKEERDVHECTQ